METILPQVLGYIEAHYPDCQEETKKFLLSQDKEGREAFYRILPQDCGYDQAHARWLFEKYLYNYEENPGAMEALNAAVTARQEAYKAEKETKRGLKAQRDEEARRQAIEYERLYRLFAPVRGLLYILKVLFRGLSILLNPYRKPYFIPIVASLAIFFFVFVAQFGSLEQCLLEISWGIDDQAFTYCFHMLKGYACFGVFLFLLKLIKEKGNMNMGNNGWLILGMASVGNIWISFTALIFNVYVPLFWLIVIPNGLVIIFWIFVYLDEL